MPACRPPGRGSRRSNAEYQPCSSPCDAFRPYPNRPQSRFDNGEARFVASRPHRDRAHPAPCLRFSSTILSDGVMIIDCHGHYTTEPKDLHRFRKEQTEAVKNKSPMPSRASLKMSRRRNPRERRRRPAQAAARARHRPHDLLAARLRHGPSYRRLRVSLEWSQICNDLIHRVCTLFPKNFIGVCQLPQIARRAADLFDQGARALRARARLRRLQPQSRPVRRLLQRAAADRQVVVSVLREDDRARRAGDDPRLAAAAIRRSTPPARTISTPTPWRSCSSSCPTCSRISRSSS